jgi:hypothetical protein
MNRMTGFLPEDPEIKYGSRFRVRTCHIRSIVESTAAQRAADRRYDRARDEEEKEVRRPWDD